MRIGMRRSMWVSRKDIDRLYEHHVLHSLGIAKVIQFHAGASILDIGTGGGFPGIPLAILFPEAQFHLVDSIGKKIKVVNEVATALELENVQGEHARAENLKSKYDYVVSRAVTALPRFLPWVKGKFKYPAKGTLDSGLLYLKGGDFHEELNSPATQKKTNHYRFVETFRLRLFRNQAGSLFTLVKERLRCLRIAID